MGLTCVAHASCLFAGRRYWSAVWQPGNCRGRWWFPETAFFEAEQQRGAEREVEHLKSNDDDRWNRGYARDQTDDWSRINSRTYIARSWQVAGVTFVSLFYRGVQTRIWKKTWARMILPMVLDTHKRVDQSANVR